MTDIKIYSLVDVRIMLNKALPAKYMGRVWSRNHPAGVEVGVNLFKGGSRAAILPIENDSRPDFVKFLAAEVMKYDV